MYDSYPTTRPLCQQRLPPPTHLYARTQATCSQLRPHGGNANPSHQILQRLCRQHLKPYPQPHPTPQPHPRPDTRPREPRQPRFTRYAPLTVARSRILDEALQADLIPPPRKMTTPPNANMTKYYRYHRNHGHTMEECKALQDKIEELVRAGHFRRFIRRDDHSSSSRSRHPPRPDHRRQPNDSHHNSHPTQPNSQQPEPARTDITPADPPLRGTINTISGGFASGGSTSSARKRHLRHIQSINHITHSHLQTSYAPNRIYR